ncbi:MAG TPA: hypothetical protein VGR35_11790 [Tepidisphaeraceae bacterium]|nr:hypothetical protein [Tepidisphaeraceae bacterium]
MDQTTDIASPGPAGGPRREPLPYAHPHPEAPRHSGLGIAATVLGCVGWVCVAGLYLLTASVRARQVQGMTNEALGMIPLMCLTPLAAAAGLGLAFAAASQRDRKRMFVTIGLALNLGLAALLAGWYLLFK